jgi:hypothetical protein
VLEGGSYACGVTIGSASPSEEQSVSTTCSSSRPTDSSYEHAISGSDAGGITLWHVLGELEASFGPTHSLSVQLASVTAAWSACSHALKNHCKKADNELFVHVVGRYSPLILFYILSYADLASSARTSCSAEKFHIIA